MMNVNTQNMRIFAKITDITDYEQMGFLDFCHEIKIIGNIHDNPELLKGETNA